MRQELSVETTDLQQAADVCRAAEKKLAAATATRLDMKRKASEATVLESAAQDELYEARDRLIRIASVTPAGE